MHLCLCNMLHCSTSPHLPPPPYLEKHTHSPAWLPARPSQSTVEICMRVTVTQNSLLFSWFTVFGSWIQLNKQWPVSQAAMATEVSGCLSVISGQSASLHVKVKRIFRKWFKSVDCIQQFTDFKPNVWESNTVLHWVRHFFGHFTGLVHEMVSFCTHFWIIICWMPLKQKMNHEKKERK